MDRRDYIMRMIEQVGAMLAALRKRILGGGGSLGEVREDLEEAARLGGLDYDLARAMSLETLLLMVAPGGEVEPGRCWLLAELSYLEGLDAQLAESEEEARRALERAGYLFGLLQPIAGNYVGIPEAAERIDEIERRLSELEGTGGGAGS